MAYNIIGALQEMAHNQSESVVGREDKEVQPVDDTKLCGEHGGTNQNQDTCPKCRAGKVGDDVAREQGQQEATGFDSFLIHEDLANDNRNPDPELQIQGFGGLLRSQIIRRINDRIDEWDKLGDDLDNAHDDNNLEELRRVAGNMVHDISIMKAELEAVRDNSLHHNELENNFEQDF